MSKKLLTLLGLLAVALFAPAGPPEGVSGAMVPDEVADGRRRYRKEMDPWKHIGLLARLACTGDVRLAAAPGEAWDERGAPSARR
jgi:hypothetical protein